MSSGARLHLARGFHLLLLGTAGAVASSCTEPVSVEPLTSRTESGVLAARAPRALSGAYTISAITLETRYWDAGSPLPNSATARAVFASLPTNAPGYTNESYLRPDLAGRIERT